MATIKPILLLVLFSGLLQSMFAANRLRYFSNLTERFNFPAAQNKCDGDGGSLVTLFDQEDANFVTNLTSIIYPNQPSYWLGLYKRLSNATTWSNGDPFNGPSVHLGLGEQRCTAIENETSMNFSCSERKPFMCQKGNTYFLIEEEKNWCQALQYCRTRSADLASVNATQQNEELNKTSWSKTFWIGLMHDEWKWDDKGCSTYRTWNITQSDGKSSFVSWTNGFEWKMAGEGINAALLCTKGHVRIKVINEPKTWEEAIDYCKAHHSRLLWIEDQEDQKAVEQWLQHTLVSSYTKSFWIALKQSSVFGFWIWSDRMVNWNNWKDGKIPEMPLSEQCGVIDADSYRWSDKNCWHRLSFLCEEDIIYMDR